MFCPVDMVERRYHPCASHGFLPLVLLPFLFFCHHASMAAAADAPSLNKTQGAIMMNLSSLVGSSRFNTTSNPCNWTGVTCSPSGVGSSLVVTNLTLRGFAISSSDIFAYICLLETLQFLDLSRTSISSFPGHSFPFPCEMSAVLLRLNLSSNRLSGPLANFSVFTKLEVLDLSFNSFTGDVLKRSISLPNLISLNLSSNSLEGTVPTSMPLTLEDLVLSRNQFTGGFPNELFQYASLTMLDLSQNDLIGQVPDDFSKLPRLTTLLLSGNTLSGSIPRSLSSLKNLSRFAANENSFTGLVPTGITNYVKLLDLSYNSLNGTIHPDLLSPLGLQAVDLTSNQLEGKIPGNISRSLYRLRLGNNFLNGSIPESIGSALNLTYLELDDNKIGGTITSELGNCKNLILLNLAYNKLEGSVPNNFSNLRELQVLKLQENKLAGSVPPVFSSLINLGILNLSQNIFSGEIPPGLFNFNLNLTNVNLQGNMFSGSIPSIPTTLTSLIELNLANNLLVGTIPSMPTSLRTALNLSHNLLRGSIPPYIGDLTNLEILDLSRNNLSGLVPSSLTDLTDLTVLDLSYNQLSGDLPIFGSFVSVITKGNPGLTNVTRDNKNYSTSLRKYSVVTIFFFSAGIFFGTLVVVFVAVYSYSKRIHHVEDAHKIINGHPTMNCIHTSATEFMKAEQDAWQITPFQALNFEVADILHGLTEESLAGSGGSGHVYRVTYTNRYNSSIGVVAVKQLRSFGSLDEKLEQEFESEARTLCNIRHNNIVKLLCCLSSVESKLLVYDYMDNGSLDRWLHGNYILRAGHSMQRVPLDWPTRLLVAVGAAQGLCYMHHECSPPIVHRDVKTSNILLDSEFRAKIADFGVARMLVREGEPNTMSAVAGSFGYMAPEYANTRKVNEKVDVYSFGVVLLELTTGNKANDGGELGCLAEWARHHYQSGASILDVIDKSIRCAGYLRETETVFSLGVKCTGILPSPRPTMKEVLQILLKCRQQTLRKSRMERSMSSSFEVAPFMLP